MLFLWQKPHICTSGELDLSLPQFYVDVDGYHSTKQEFSQHVFIINFRSFYNCDIRLINQFGLCNQSTLHFTYPNPFFVLFFSCLKQSFCMPPLQNIQQIAPTIMVKTMNLLHLITVISPYKIK